MYAQLMTITLGMLLKLSFNRAGDCSIFVILIIFIMTPDTSEADTLKVTVELFDKVTFHTNGETIRIEMWSPNCLEWDSLTVHLLKTDENLIKQRSRLSAGRYSYDLHLKPNAIFIKDGKKLSRKIFDGSLLMSCYDGGIEMTFHGVSLLEHKSQYITTMPLTITAMPLTTTETPTSSDTVLKLGLQIFIYATLATVVVFVLVLSGYVAHKKCKKPRRFGDNGDSMTLDNTTSGNRQVQGQYPRSNRHRRHRQHQGRHHRQHHAQHITGHRRHHRQHHAQHITGHHRLQVPHPGGHHREHQAGHPTERHQFISDHGPSAPSAPQIESDSPPDYRDVEGDFTLPPPSYQEAVYSVKDTNS